MMLEKYYKNHTVCCIINNMDKDNMDERLKSLSYDALCEVCQMHVRVSYQECFATMRGGTEGNISIYNCPICSTRVLEVVDADPQRS